MSEHQYVGARYVPKFSDPVEWQSGTSYEALTIVTYNNSSYTSKVPVPATVGNPADNSQFWALTGNYNSQVELYRVETQNVKNSLDSINQSINSLNSDYQSIASKLTRISTPESYGAKGDGTTDDSQAVQNAIDNNDVVILDGTKTYLVNTTPYVSHSGFALIGNGAKIKKGTGHTTALYIGTDSADIQNVIIDNVEFIGNKNVENEFPTIRVTVTNETHYIYNLIINNCYIHGTNGYGIGLYNNGSAASHLRATVSNNYLYDVGGVGICCSKVEAKVVQNTCTGTGAESITLDNVSENSIIYGNTLSGFGNSGIGTDGAKNCIYSHNVIVSSSDLPAIQLNANQGVCDNCVITDNAITNTNQGIYIVHCTKTIISNNINGNVLITGTFTTTDNCKIFNSGVVTANAVSDSIFVNSVITDQSRTLTLTTPTGITFTGHCYYENGVVYIYGDFDVKNATGTITTLATVPWNIGYTVQYDNVNSEDDTLRLGSLTFTGNQITSFVKSSSQAYVPINVAFLLK